MNNILSDRLNKLSPSATLAMSQRSGELKAQGVDVINLSVGEPDFNTPDHIKEAAKKAIDDNWTRYSPVPGYPDLKKAISDKLARENNLNYSPDEILTSNGAKQCVCNAVLALVNPGDEVIIPAPYWVSYPQMVKLAEGTPVFVEAKIEADFKITPAQLESVITPRTKMIILNTPSNPTGCVIPADTLKQIADIAMKNNIKVMSDEIYSAIIYEGKHTSMASFPGMFENTILISGLSKTFAMTGWRIGWAIAPAEDIKNINKLQSHSISCCTSFAQKGAIEALTGPQESKFAMVKEFKKRRDLALDLIRDIPGMECNTPNGAFYLFPKYNKDIPSAKLAEIMLKEDHVAVTPGTAFGPCGEGFFRISYATSEDQIQEGIARIKKSLSKL